MPQSLAAVYLHVVFSTKNRQPMITADLAPRLSAYIGGIARGNKHVLLHAGGVADHVHLLISLYRIQSIADMVSSLKSGSSRWVHDTFQEPQIAEVRGEIPAAGHRASSQITGRSVKRAEKPDRGPPESGSTPELGICRGGP